MKDMLVGISIVKAAGRDAKPIPNKFEQVDVFKNDFYSIRVALFSKADFVDVKSANGQITASLLRIQNLDRPFHLSIAE